MRVLRPPHSAPLSLVTAQALRSSCSGSSDVLVSVSAWPYCHTCQGAGGACCLARATPLLCRSSQLCRTVLGGRRACLVCLQALSCTTSRHSSCVPRALLTCQHAHLSGDVHVWGAAAAVRLVRHAAQRSQAGVEQAQRGKGRVQLAACNPRTCVSILASLLLLLLAALHMTHAEHAHAGLQIHGRAVLTCAHT
jgi:hypothetical protein